MFGVAGWCPAGLGRSQSRSAAETSPALLLRTLIGPSGCAFHPGQKNKGGGSGGIDQGELRSQNVQLLRIYGVPTSCRPSKSSLPASVSESAALRLLQFPPLLSLWRFYSGDLQSCSACSLTANPERVYRCFLRLGIGIDDERCSL